MQAMGPNLNQDSMQCMLVSTRPIKQMLDQPTASKQVSMRRFQLLAYVQKANKWRRLFFSPEKLAAKVRKSQGQFCATQVR